MEHRVVVVELVVLLHQIIDVARYDGRAKGTSSLLHHLGVVCNLGDQGDLLSGESKIRGQNLWDSSEPLLLGSTDHAADTSVGVLDE